MLFKPDLAILFQVHLMRFIIAFTPDFLPLSRPDLCEKFVLVTTSTYLSKFALSALVVGIEELESGVYCGLNYYVK